MTPEMTAKVLADYEHCVEKYKRNPNLRASPKAGKIISDETGSIRIYFPSGTQLKLANSYREWQMNQIAILQNAP